MPIIKNRCPNKKCNKVAKEVSASVQGNYRVIKLECGHTICETQDKTKDDRVIFLDGVSEPYPFQYEGIRFAEETNLQCVIADEMRLGKTIQLLGALKRHAKTALPAIGVVKASILIQWQHECVRVLGKEHFVQILQGKNDPILPGFSVYLISYDSLHRFNLEKLKEQIKPKTVFFDECQQIKNPEAKRTKACQELSRGVPHRMATSGTYIKNNAGEAFPIMNIIRPTQFPSYQGFIDDWVSSDGYKLYGIQRGRLDEWKELLSTFVIRRERKDVLPDLPPINRTFFYTQLGEVVQSMYNEQMKGFMKEYESTEDSSSFGATSNLLSYITKMRHITGLAKVEPCVEWVEDFLFSTQDKLTIFVHHQDVGEILFRQLREKLKEGAFAEPLKFTASMDYQARFEAIERFKRPESRIMVASTLAAGEGVTFPECQIVMLERQWNPANEEQAEARPIKMDKLNRVDATYFLATGTIDEYFADIVEQKRKIVKQTMNGDMTMTWSEESLMRELIEYTAREGTKKWKGWK